MPTSRAAVAEELSRRLFLTDTHCHIRLASSLCETDAHSETVKTPFSCGVRKAIVCGTHPDIDWPLIETAATASASSSLRLEPASSCVEVDMQGFVVPGFGIHPWFVPHDEEEEGQCTAHDLGHIGGDLPAGRSPTELLELLENALRRFPQAIVGEIGLDKLRGPPEAVQLPLFLAQMRLAARYDRVVSVHCVRSFGTMLTALQQLKPEDTPPAILLHGFTGSLDFVRSSLKIRKKFEMSASACARATVKAQPIRIYFGVGAATSLRVKGFLERTLPFLLEEGRAILETDAHYLLCYSDVASDSPVTPPQETELPGHTVGAAAGVDGRSPVLRVCGCAELARALAVISDNNFDAAERLVLRCEEAFMGALSLSTHRPPTE